MIFMKVIITGMNGTLAPYISNYFTEQGYELIVWERQHVPIDNLELIKGFIESHQPDLFLHIATGPVSWIENIIKCIKPFGIPLVFISSEAVFDGLEGPFTTMDITKSKDDYGHYKIDAENIINMHYREQTYLIRIGWQIALHTHKNNMLAFLINEENIHASSDWVLATSFMTDTAEAIFKLIKHHPTGLYHLDSNQSNMSFYDLVIQLKEIFKLPITIEETRTTKHNNRLLSDTILIRSLEESLETLKKKHHI
jgi:dTDP-4-dehydrorhamnose reductase